jgi:hypothetical protein
VRRRRPRLGDQKLYRVLTEELCFDYVIRFRGNIAVTATTGETRTAAAWVPSQRTRPRAARCHGHRRSLPGGDGGLRAGPGHEAGLVPGRQQQQCHHEASHRILRPSLGHRVRMRDTKDLRFGMGMGAMHVNSPERRDRLWLLNAFAVVLLTLLGAAGEALGYDRMLKTNTVKRHVHSLFRQGCLLYDLIPTMPQIRLRPLMQCFSRMLLEQPLFADVFGPV